MIKKPFGMIYDIGDKVRFNGLSGVVTGWTWVSGIAAGYYVRVGEQTWGVPERWVELEAA